LTSSESQLLFDNLPTFKPIPAYVCGYVPRDEKYRNISYSGKKGRKNYKIFSWNGPIEPGDLEHIKNKEEVVGKVTFEGIGEFAHDKGYLFNTGNLLWCLRDWQVIIDQL